MGRRSKMTDARVTALLNALRVGNTRRAACAHADIDPTTFYRWLDQDATFRNAIEKAEGEAESHYSTIIFRAASTTWQAAAWWLERRHPKDFGRRDQVDVQLDVQRMAERLATESGLEPAPILAEAERLARLASG